MACDPNFDDVVLLAHFDTPNTFVDSSSFAQAITAAGNGAADATNKEFGTSSLGFVADGNFNGVTVADAPSLDFGTGDWVIEGFIFWPLINPGTNSAWIEKYQFTSLYPYQIITGSSNGLTANGADGIGTTVYSLSGPSAGDGSLVPGAFNYIVLQRSGSTFSLYVNGFLVDTDTYAGLLASNNYPVLIGTQGSGYTANIDEVRFTKGFARYSGSTIPVPTGPFGVACPTQALYPDLRGGTYADAQAIIAASVFPALNPVVEQPNAGVPIGQVFLQSPPANSLQNLNVVGTVTVSSGAPSDDVTVPQIGLQPDPITPLTPEQANAALIAAGLTEGAITISTDPGGTPGTVFSQDIAAGSVVPRGTAIAYTVTSVLKPFDPSVTVISEYANSPTILALIANMSDYLRPDVNFEAFYSYVWNVDTAQGFGLDIWGKIVGISRQLKIPVDSPVFGFENSDVPPDWSPFNQGTFSTGNSSSQTYTLTDPAYRTLILTKALSNIAATTAPALNRLLQNLFPGRGKAYVIDRGGMAMSFVFEFSLSPVEFAILTQSGALPHPAGVSFDVSVLPTGDFFGFAEQGGDAQPFDQGVFFS